MGHWKSGYRIRSTPVYLILISYISAGFSYIVCPLGDSMHSFTSLSPVPDTRRPWPLHLTLSTSLISLNRSPSALKINTPTRSRSSWDTDRGRSFVPVLLYNYFNDVPYSYYQTLSLKPIRHQTLIKFHQRGPDPVPSYVSDWKHVFLSLIRSE